MQGFNSHGLSPKTSLHSRCRLQHPTPPHFGQNPPHLPGRGNGGMVSSRYRKVNNNTCRQFVARFIRLRDRPCRTMRSRGSRAGLVPAARGAASDVAGVRAKSK